MKRSRRVILMVMGICVIGLFDLYFTVNAHQNDVLGEANPIARVFLSGGGLWVDRECRDFRYYLPIVIYKLALLALGATTLLFLRKNLIAEVAVTVLFVIYIGLSLHWNMFYTGAM